MQIRGGKQLAPDKVRRVVSRAKDWGIPVEVTTLSGATYQGSVAAIGAHGFVVDELGVRQGLSFDRIRRALFDFQGVPAARLTELVELLECG